MTTKPSAADLAGDAPCESSPDTQEDSGGLRFVVVYGSVREKRQGIRAARFIVRRLEARGHHVDLIDPLEVQLPLLDKTYAAYGGEYNHSPPPVLKNLIDYFLHEYFWRPAGIVTYSAGSFGGVRAGVHLRTVLGEVGLATIPSMLPVPKVHEAFEMDGTPKGDRYEKRADRFLGELCWYARALKAARADGVPYE